MVIQEYQVDSSTPTFDFPSGSGGLITRPKCKPNPFCCRLPASEVRGNTSQLDGQNCFVFSPQIEVRMGEAFDILILYLLGDGHVLNAP